MVDNKEKDIEFSKVLEGYVKDYKILMDTCSLLEPSVEMFWKNIIYFLHVYLNKIIIPLRCIEELQKHEKNSSDQRLSERAKQCLKQIHQLINAGYVAIYGDETDEFADNVFNVVFTKFRMKYKLLLITQDHSLAEEYFAFECQLKSR